MKTVNLRRYIAERILSGSRQKKRTGGRFRGHDGTATPQEVELLEEKVLLSANDQISEAFNIGDMSQQRVQTGFTISDGADVDMLSFTVTSGQRVQIDLDRTSNSNLDSVLRLFNSSGTQLAFNDNGAAPGESRGLDSYIDHTFSAAGRYYLGVSAFGNSSYNPVTGTGDRTGSTFGGFTLTLTPITVNPDSNDQISESINLGTISSTHQRSGTINPGNDVDMYSIDVSAGQTVNLDIDRPSGSLDSVLRLFNSSGTQLASNDDATAPGESFSVESFIRHTFSSSGRFYVGVSNFGNSGYNAVTGTGDRTGSTTGSYTLIASTDADNNDAIREAIGVGRLTATGTSRSGSISPANDVDMYAFSVGSGQQVRVDVDRTSGNLDSFIRLFDSSGNQLASNDDGAAPGESGSLDSYLQHTVTTGGTYYLGISDLSNRNYNAVTGFGDSTTGSRTGGYRIGFSVASTNVNSDSNDQIREAQSLGAVSTTRTRSGQTIGRGDDVDMFSFSVTSGQAVQFDINRTSGTLDSVLRVFDSSGRQLDFNDDGAAPGESSSLDSYLQRTFTSGGTYYVGVSAFGNSSYSATLGTGDRNASSTGGYTLIVSPTDTDSNDQINEANSVGSISTTEVSRTGSVSPSRDVDMYSFSVTAGQRVAIDVDRTSGNLDSYIRLFDSSGAQLRFNDDGRAIGEGSSLDSYIDHTFTAGGTYYLGISDLSNRSYNAVTGLGDSTAGTRTGGYRLGFRALVTNAIDPNDQISEASSLGTLTSSGVSRSDAIGQRDVDMFAFTVTSGTTVTIDLDRTSGNLDSLIRVFDSSGAVVVRNDDGRAPGESSSLDSFIFHTFSASGTYYIGVSDLANSLYNPVTGGSDSANTRTGNYRINVSIAAADRNDSISEATFLGAMTQDRTQAGFSIDPATDVDMFSFNVDGGQTIGIDVDRASGSSLDSFLRIFDSAGRLLAWNDDGAAPGESSSLESYIEHTFSTAGRYYAGISGFGNSGYNAVNGGGDRAGSTGAFTLNLKRVSSGGNADPNDQLAEASHLGALTSTRTRTASIGTGSDVDMYGFTATAGQLVSIDIDRPSGSQLDSVLRLFDSTGRQIDFNDDAPGPGERSSLESFLQLRLSASGTYYVGVSAFGNRNYNAVDGTGDRPGSTSGDYSLIVSAVDDPDDQIGEAISLGTLSSTVSRTGQSISSGTDVDMYSVRVSAGQRVGIDIDRPNGGTFDSYLRLFDSAGNSLAVSDDTAGPGESFSLESYIVHTFATAGTYYIGVSGFGNSSYSATTGDGDRTGSSGLFSIIVTSLSSPTSDDRFENNDTLATAHNFGTVRGLRFERNLIMGDSSDFFRFTTVGTGGGGNYARINFQHRNGDLDMRLRDSTGRILSSSISTTNTEQVSLARLPAGTYFVEVYGYRGAFNPSYSLTLATPGGAIPVLPDDTFENNDTRATASNLGTLTAPRTLSHLAMRDSADWFRFRQNGTGTAANFVRINFLIGQGDLDLEVFNSSGRLVDRSVTVSNGERVSLDRSVPGEYFIRVFGRGGGTNPSYSLTVNPGIQRVQPPIRDDLFENNDTRATAARLGTLTSRRTLTNLAMSDAADFYTFRTNGTGAADSSVQINFDHSRGDLDLVVLNSAGTRVGRSVGFTNTERVSLANQPPGEYTVLVYGYRGARNPNYSLTINPTTATAPPSGRDTLYLVFDGATLSNSQLRSWAGSDWGGSINSYIDPEGDGVRVNRFLSSRSDREAVISGIITNLRNDLSPFGINVVRRTTGSAVAGQGATTLFFGPHNMRGVGHVAADIDYANNNMTDIAFVEDENWGGATSTALALADVALHEAGHTYGLFHVNTVQNGILFSESMGLRYSSAQNRWLRDTAFLNRTFSEYLNHGGGRGSQNTFTTMQRNFGVTTGNPSAQAAFSAAVAAENSIPNSQIIAELMSDSDGNGDGHLHDHDHDHDHDDQCLCAACTGATDHGTLDHGHDDDHDKTAAPPRVNLTGKVFAHRDVDIEYSIERLIDAAQENQDGVTEASAEYVLSVASVHVDASEIDLPDVEAVGASDADGAFSDLDRFAELMNGTI